MPETEGLTRKRKVRAAHRGSVTRIISQVYESLESGEALNLPRLRQQKLQLSGKLDVLSKLDDELIEMVAEDELDVEVEQADVIKEKIGLCIMDIDQALERPKTADTSRADGRTTPPTEDSTSTHTRSGGTPPTPPSTEGDGSCTDPVDPTLTPPPTDPGGATPLSSITPRVKLPKLSIKKFNGDLTKWVTFWDSFDSSIHSNPSLSNVDKFNYLNSFLESTAAESVAGLTLTSANYEEAVATLKRRFGNTQLIINKHMDALLNLPAVSSHHDIKGLRHLYDSVEAHVRGLRALGVTADSYGGLLTSILMNKLPSEIRLIISRELTEEKWDVEKLMKIVDREVDARERSAASRTSNPNSTPAPKRPLPRAPPTAAALMTSNVGPAHCAFCEQNHVSSSCTVVTDISARKEVLRKAGRCYVCLRKGHISRDCRSTGSCNKCRGRHHHAICPRRNESTTNPSTTSGPITEDVNQASGATHRPTNVSYVDSQTPILLQTAKLQLYNLDDNVNPPSCIEARAVMDSGSQRTYVTSRLKESLHLPTKRTESLRIKTFGSTEGHDTTCEAVDLGLVAKDGETLRLTALVVPFICNPLTSQPINHARNHYDHLLEIDLADSASIGDTLEVDVLIGSDFYWSLVTGRVRRGRSGPMAIHTKVGWILSGPIDRQEVSVNLTLTATHALRIDTHPVERNLDDQLRRFWELESLGIAKDEPSVYDKFVQQISFDGERYQVSLPWRENTPPLPDTFELCRRRLDSLLRRLKQNPPLLAEYNSVIRDQLRQGIIEVVDDPSSEVSERVHYLPHHGVVRQDKTTSKLRIVYDASAKTSGPSLNDCLYTGPSFGQSIFDILLRFRFHRVALAGDIEKAFLMVSVRKKDRDSLRFLWTHDVNRDSPEVVVMRFTRVVFGVNSSPFLLNATIDHHMRRYQAIDPLFVDKFLSSIYVDDVSLGSNDVESTYELYLKSKSRLAEAGFKLRKFITNSDELRSRVDANEEIIKEQTMAVNMEEEDQSYAKGSLGVKSAKTDGRHKILGVQWDFVLDTLTFNIGDVSHYMENSEPTKRNVVSMTARFFDPLGVVSPVTILFKVFFQCLCEAGVGWDAPLTGDLLRKWSQLLSSLQGPESLVIPRCYFSDVPDCPKSVRLVGFCDASAKAYAAVVYLRIEGETQVCVRFVAAKTRVAPLGGMTIPRLELLSALLLSKLIVSVRTALQPEVTLGDPVCYTDSRVALYWIQGCQQEWKQFVENRVTSILASVQPQCWEHCPGRENPADIPSRGMTASELSRNSLWLSGPDWLSECQDLPGEDLDADSEVPEECRREMKSKKTAHTLVVVQNHGPRLGQLISCENFSSLHRLLRVTTLVLRFVCLLHLRVGKSSTSVTADSVSGIDQARLYWLRDVQSQLEQNSKFPVWKYQFDLFLDKSQLWRCGGRMANSDLPSSARNPILLDKGHPLTSLIVMDAHRRVMHNGVKETLTELRSAYWLIRGRQFIRKIVHSCLTCRKLEGKPFQSVPSPPLPEYRVRRSQPFCYTGVDFAGPLYVKASVLSEGRKVWLCLYTCCVTRAVHLDLVPNLNAFTFLRSFKRFTARRGIPSRIVSDNGKTFKSASKLIQGVFDEPEVKKHFTALRVEWAFNLEKAPWWGGIFERMIKSAKRCLKKSVGRASLTYDELSTLVIEIEAVLNSRPLTYVSMDDLEEPLTPSHLLLGYRVLSLPDPPLSDDPDYGASANDLSRRMKHLLKTSERFWKRWKKEYLLELREFHRTSRISKGVKETVQEGQIITVYDEGQPRGLWRVGRIEEVIPGTDGMIRSARVRVQSKTGRTTVLKRPIQHLYPLEIGHEKDSQPEIITTDEDTENNGTPPIPQCEDERSSVNTETPQGGRPRRSAAIEARDKILGCVTD